MILRSKYQKSKPIRTSGLDPVTLDLPIRGQGPVLNEKNLHDQVDKIDLITATFECTVSHSILARSENTSN